MESSSNKSGNNKNTLKWILKRTKKYFPLIVFHALLSVITSATAIFTALISKELLDIATGSSQGSITKIAIKLFAVIFIEVVILGLDTIFKTIITGKLTIHFRKNLFKKISRRK